MTERELNRVVAGFLRAHPPACIWFHVPNEGKRSKVGHSLAFAEGLQPGAADFFFAWHDGNLGIELKVGDRKQDKAQIDFEKWCGDHMVPYHVERSLEAVVHRLIVYERFSPSAYNKALLYLSQTRR